jgi:hypothetical protein
MYSVADSPDPAFFVNADPDPDPGIDPKFDKIYS